MLAGDDVHGRRAPCVLRDHRGVLDLDVAERDAVVLAVELGHAEFDHEGLVAAVDEQVECCLGRLVGVAVGVPCSGEVGEGEVAGLTVGPVGEPGDALVGGEDELEPRGAVDDLGARCVEDEQLGGRGAGFVGARGEQPGRDEPRGHREDRECPFHGSAR